MSYAAGSDDEAVCMLNGDCFSLPCDGEIVKSTGNTKASCTARSWLVSGCRWT